MAVYSARKKVKAVAKARKARARGLRASVRKAKKGWKIYVNRKR